jgi:hypothetical protein
MEEFDINFDDHNIGTSISKIKNYGIEGTIDRRNKRGKKKKHIDMNNFAKTIESNIESVQTLDFNNDNGISAVNDRHNNNVFNSLSLNPLDNDSRTIKISNVNLDNIQTKISKKKSKLINNDYMIVLLYMLFFVLLNNKLVIQYIYDILGKSKMNSPFSNLLIRTSVFGLIIIIMKMIS